MDLDYRALGTNIRGHRKKRDMTQADLAEAVGVSDSHIGKIETGRGIPSLATVAAIANSLEVGLDTLLHGDIHYKTDFFMQELIQLTEGFDYKDKDHAIGMLKLFMQTIRTYKK